MATAKSTIKFDSEFHQSKKLGILLSVSDAASEKINTEDKAAVEGIINFLPFRSSLVTDNAGKQWIKVDTATHAVMQKLAEKNAEKSAQKNTRENDSNAVTVEITRIGDEVETRVPADLRKALSTSPKAKAVWDDITPIARRDWIFWIITGKLKETRTIRIEKACDMLSHGKRRVCCFAGINWLIKTA